MKTYEAIARAIEAEGCNAAYTLLGDANMLIMGALDAVTSTKLVHARHENSAVAMADGYARLTGRVGVASVTAGPGLTNVATSLIVAVKHRSPLVVIAGDIPQYAPYHGQEFDQATFVRSTGAVSIRIDSPARALPQLRKAFFLAQKEQTPVVLTVPLDVQTADFPADWAYQPAALEIPPVQRLRPELTAVRRVAEAIAQAERPLIIAGRGAVDSGAHDAAIALGDSIGALLGTTLRAKGFFRDDEFSIGIIGSLGTKAARKLIASSDCIIGIGAALGHYTAEDRASFGNATIVQIDTAPPAYFQGRFIADHYLIGDARATTEELVGELSGMNTAGDGYRTDEIRQLLVRLSEPPAYEAEEIEEGFVHPAHAMRALDKALQPHHHVVVGGGGFWTFPGTELTSLAPGGYNFEADFMAISQALSMAIGAAAADNSRRIIAIEGDGSALMNIQEFDAMAAAGIPVMYLVINDAAYGAEVHGLAGAGLDGSLAQFRRLDFTKIAESFGVRGIRLESAADLPGLVREFDESGVPMIVEIPMSSKVISSRIRRMKYGQDA